MIMISGKSLTSWYDDDDMAVSHRMVGAWQAIASKNLCNYRQMDMLSLGNDDDMAVSHRGELPSSGSEISS